MLYFQIARLRKLNMNKREKSKIRETAAGLEEVTGGQVCAKENI